MRYFPKKIEEKWRKWWLKNRTYEPDFEHAQKPFYNLMMFPYPSAEGLHIGSVRTFTGVDIYGRLKRMQGYDLFEPIGLDGFGIHSENYALKVGKHPFQHARDSEKNFYRQLGTIGNGFAWEERLETYNPLYYKWTQWIFVQMFKRGLAYRKKSPVNWCPSCKTVLADEQVLHGECERCQSKVVKKDLEQWFFRITKYADRLLKNLDNLPDRQAGIDWSEPIKIAQRNWIGKSEGAEIDFPIATKYNYVLIHGYTGTSEGIFFPWLKNELKKRGLRFFAPNLPHPDAPSEEEQVNFVLNNVRIDENTVLFGHSLGAVVAMKIAEKLNKKIAGLVLAGGFIDTKFRDKPRPFNKTFSWEFNFGKIRQNSGFVTILSDPNDYAVPLEQGRILREKLNGVLIEKAGQKPHFTNKEEPILLQALVPSLKVFTTRPDTLFGATYMVLGPEHPLVTSYQLSVTNRREVEDYIKKAKVKTDEERIAEGKEKTGIELKGVKAINPANGEEIPVWVADYVLGNVGTGAIMAVPAHDQRDFEFAKKFNLSIKIVVCPHYPEKTCPVLDEAYTGEGHLVGSGRFDGMDLERAKWEITKFVGGQRKVNYRLRDWLISRQRYWGPPIPLVFCENCSERIKNQESRIKRTYSKGELENPGWIAVPEKNLPVKLPYIKNFRPTGTEKSPLALVEKFYKIRCPKCGSGARRETDVSDTFLDSAWYYLRYPSVRMKNSKIKMKNGNAKSKISEIPWNREITQKWLPVDMYIGGAEHAVLHLLYVRFLSMALHDIGVLNFPAKGGSASGGEEPFKKFRTHGLITKDGAKMSKSKGNIVNPDEYINAYGSDAIRMYLAFLAPLPQGGDFRDEGIKGVTRFLERVWRFFEETKDEGRKTKALVVSRSSLVRLIHKTIKKVTEDLESFQYNTAISALMMLLNFFEENQDAVTKEDVKVFLKLLAPLAPHISEELWQQLQDKSKKIKDKKLKSIHIESWPKYNPKLIEEETFELVIQVNGKVRGKIILPRGTSEEEAKKEALKKNEILKYLPQGPKKTIFVPNKLINFVV